MIFLTNFSRMRFINGGRNHMEGIKKSFVPFFLLLLTFVSGMMVDRFLFNARPFPCPPPFGRGERQGFGYMREGGHEGILGRYRKELALTDDQAKKIEDVLEKNRKEFFDFRKDFEPKIDEMKAKTRTEIRGFLNAEQQKKFDELQERFDKRFKEHREPPPPPGF